MKRFYYHGTSADNLESILKHGLSCNESNLWNCSQDEIYLWDIEGTSKANLNDDSTIQEKEMECFRMATESGQVACCAAKDCRIVVIKVLIDEREVEIDRSCANMEGRGAVTINRDILPSEIIEIRVSNDLSLIKGYFMAMMIDNEYNGIEFSDIEQRIAKAFKGIELYPEDIDDLINWENVPVPKTKLKTA